MNKCGTCWKHKMGCKGPLTEDCGYDPIYPNVQLISLNEQSRASTPILIKVLQPKIP